MDKILLSVIITTYKRSDTLTRAIESVLSQKGCYELIVVDDNDPDTEYRSETNKKMISYQSLEKVTYIQHPKNMNGSTARNTGICFAKGLYITFLDDDDVFCSNRIEKIENVIKKEKPDFIYTGFKRCCNNKTNLIVTEMPRKGKCELISDILKQKLFVGTGSNIVCKKSIVDDIGGFDTSFVRHQDLEFLIRYLERCETIIQIPEVLVIKNDDDLINMPSFEKYYKVKNDFLAKFKYIICKMSENDRKEVYSANIYPLLDIALYKKNKAYINKSIEMLKMFEVYNGKKISKMRLKNNLKRSKVIYIVWKKFKSVTLDLYASKCNLVQKRGEECDKNQTTAS